MLSIPDKIPHLEFGEHGYPLHFLHANGYPPAAYTPLLKLLSQKFHCYAMELRPLWPNTNPAELSDWQPLAQDLMAFLGSFSDGTWIGVGHSVGATTTLRAALSYPNAFNSLILIDPVLYPPWMIYLWKSIEAFGLGSRLHPLIPGALRRRREFASPTAMFENYRQKDVFSRMNDASLWAYVEAIASPNSNGLVHLVYPPEWEARIYSTGIKADLDIWQSLSQLTLPLFILRGQETDTFWQSTAHLIQKHLPEARIATIPGSGHLLPLEKPDTVNHCIQIFLAEHFAVGKPIS